MGWIGQQILGLFVLPVDSFPYWKSPEEFNSKKEPMGGFLSNLWDLIGNYILTMDIFLWFR